VSEDSNGNSKPNHNNARISISRHKNEAKLVATKNIKNGEEIFCRMVHVSNSVSVHRIERYIAERNQSLKILMGIVIDNSLFSHSNSNLVRRTKGETRECRFKMCYHQTQTMSQ
jgi:hypothetical protein